MNEHRVHWLLESDLVFLNHGSFGACPTPVLEQQNELRELMERNPVHFFGCEMLSLMHKARERLGTFLNAAARRREEHSAISTQHSAFSGKTTLAEC